MEKDINKSRWFNRLFWQISITFLVVLIVFTAIALYISVQSARHYALEVNQKLNRSLAAYPLNEVEPFIGDSINKEAMADIMHSMMVINPSVEVYLLDDAGTILYYFAPDSLIKLDKVSLVDINRFLSDEKESIIYGDDPRNPGEKKIFSAAEIHEGKEHKGYIYIILASQEYVSAAQMVLGSYILGLSIRSIILILIITSIVGLIAFWLITKKLNSIIKGIQQFRSGELSARVPVKKNDDLDKIGVAFNDMADTIEKNIEELKGIDSLRKELINNISHDLRTPVASIQGYAETLLLKKDDISEKEKENYLNIIVKGTERLKKLVGELFELSKLQTNQIKLNPEPFSIAELVQDVAGKYRMISQKKGISINTIMSKDIPLVNADISLIDRVLQNLIDNAIKFCKEEDYINLEINSLNPQKIQLKIADSGQGISQEDLPHIFERYYKGRKYNEGTGLGLAIVKKIIELHHSSIKVFSQQGKGTTFTFSLPIANIA